MSLAIAPRSARSTRRWWGTLGVYSVHLTRATSGDEGLDLLEVCEFRHRDGADASCRGGDRAQTVNVTMRG